MVDSATMDFEAIENASSAAAQGAGIATAQMIADKGVEAVLTGNCGPNAHQALSAAAVKVVTGVSGTVREAVGAYAGGTLQTSEQPNVASHYGMGMGAGRGMGGGMAGGDVPSPAVRSAQAGPGLTDLLLELKSQLDGLREQVSDINRRIDELHNDQ